MRAREPGVPLRLWLMLALVAIVGAPTLVTWGLGQTLSGWQHGADQARWAAVRAAVGADVSRWHEPTWQRRAVSTFTTLGVEAGLVDKRPGHTGLAFATAAGRRFMDDLGLLPSAVPERKHPRAARAAARGAASGMSPADSLTYRAIPILAAATTGRARVAGVANIWFVRPLPSSSPFWIALAGGLAALLMALGVVAVFLTRSVVRPLTAMGAAARQVAAGALDLRLPSSAAREVAEVTAALEMMSAELRAAVRRQAALEQERRVFIGAIAHDLRTPLFTLSSYLSGLRDGVAATPEKAAQYLAVCQEQTAQLEHLVADLFAFATVEYLEQQPRREPVDVGQVLRQAVESVQPRAARSGVSVSVSGPGGACPLLADAHALTRVVENLLDNALRYTPRGGRVAVRWGRDAQTSRVSIAVEDTGPGLAVEELPHLFTPFYRGDAARQQHSGGVGLGLAIARRIVQAHGGDLTAANAPIGGALFTATFADARGTVAAAEPSGSEQRVRER